MVEVSTDMFYQEMRLQNSDTPLSDNSLFFKQLDVWIMYFLLIFTSDLFYSVKIYSVENIKIYDIQGFQGTQGLKGKNLYEPLKVCFYYVYLNFNETVLNVYLFFLTADSVTRSSLAFLGKAKVRTLKMTIIIVFVFFVCWTPYHVMCVW